MDYILLRLAGYNNRNHHISRGYNGVSIDDRLLGGRHNASPSFNERHPADLPREPTHGNVHIVRPGPAADRHVYAVRVQDAQPAGELQRSQVHWVHHVHHLRHLDRVRRPPLQHRQNG